MADGNSLGNALKYLRRHVHLYGSEWRVLVVSKTLAQQKIAADEIMRVLDAGSIKIESINRAEGWIQLAKGAMITFRHVAAIEDAHKLAGRSWTQIVWMYEPDDQRLRQIIGIWLRSSNVPHDQLVDEKIDW